MVAALQPRVVDLTPGPVAAVLTPRVAGPRRGGGYLGICGCHQLTSEQHGEAFGGGVHVLLWQRQQPLLVGLARLRMQIDAAAAFLGVGAGVDQWLLEVGVQRRG